MGKTPSYKLQKRMQAKMKIDSKELKRIIDEETEKFVEKVELRDPLLMQEKLKRLSKEQIIDLLKEDSISKEFLLENASNHLLFKLFKAKKKNESVLNEQQDGPNIYDLSEEDKKLIPLAIQQWNQIKIAALKTDSPIIAFFTKNPRYEHIGDKWLDLFNGQENTAFRLVGENLNFLNNGKNRTK